MAQMIEQIKTPEKELSDKEIDNPSDADVQNRVQNTDNQNAYRIDWA